MPNKRVLVLGATGTIGRAVFETLIARKIEAVCVVRARPTVGDAQNTFASKADTESASVVFGDPTDPKTLRTIMGAQRFDAVVSCLASRTGVPADAWAIDHDAHVRILEEAQRARIASMVLLSAICVQKPRLEFQAAKLAFEASLMRSGLTYSIVRPTAYFKSLSGQIQRLREGKPFLVFGDGALTATKPISAGDLANYMIDCLDTPTLQNRVLPIGGPGKAITPLQQGEHLFHLLGQKPKFRKVPVAVLATAAKALSSASKLVPALSQKAELAKIGLYYATESMLVLDPATGRYDAAATPSYGTETLFEFYARLISGEATLERGAHAVF
ncbi:MAG: NAD(P)H-binding protein [Pseudomonadota bacterium]